MCIVSSCRCSPRFLSGEKRRAALLCLIDSVYLLNVRRVKSPARVLGLYRALLLHCLRRKETMQSITLHPSTENPSPADLAAETARLEALLELRRAELVSRQEEMRAFKQRYAQAVGDLLTELAEVESAIGEAERRTLGLENAADAEDETAVHSGIDADGQSAHTLPVKTALRKLFWSVARMFHPDHAPDEAEAQRRHSIMAEASRAYREGDVESLHTLLGDEELQSYCATMPGGEDDLARRLLNLKEELRTVEFGLKRIRQDRLYQLKLSADEEARHGRDKLKQEAERLNRRLVKARRRLEHLS